MQKLQSGKFVQNQSLHREFLLHRALIEAVVSKKAEAKENLAKAQAMDEKEEIKNEQQPISSRRSRLFSVPDLIDPNK